MDNKVVTDLCTCNRPIDRFDATCLECGKPIHVGEFHQRWHTGPRFQCATCRQIEAQRQSAAERMTNGNA